MSDPSAIFKIFRGLNPYPTTELIYDDAFQLLIAVILSAQATDVSVNQGTQTLFKIAKDAKSIKNLGEARLIPHIQHIGLYKTKAKNVIKTCQIIDETYHGSIPRSRQQLEALPGVGRKTANVVLNTAFAQSTMAVDTHIFRVSHRLGWSQGRTPEDVEQDLYRLIPAAYLLDAHHWLILHGRYICKARKPACALCPIQTHCNYKDHAH